jgi:hypothetical protein
MNQKISEILEEVLVTLEKSKSKKLNLIVKKIKKAKNKI